MGTAAPSILSRLERFLPRQAPSRSFVWYSAFTAACFLLFLALTFPHDLVARRLAEQIARDTGWVLRFDDTWLVPWDGYRFSNLSVSVPGERGQAWIGAKRAGLRPSLGAIFGGRLSGVSFWGEAYGGRLSGWIRLGENTSLEALWSGISLEKHPKLPELVNGQWSGTFSGQIALQFKESVKDAEGRGRLTLKDGGLVGGNARGFTIPDLTSTSGDVEFEVRAGRLELRTFKLTGAQIDADVRGQIYLRAPLTQSVLNATASVKPVPGAAPGIEGLLTLANRGQRPAGGTYSLTLYGVITQPKIR